MGLPGEEPGNEAATELIAALTADFRPRLRVFARGRLAASLGTTTAATHCGTCFFLMGRPSEGEVKKGRRSQKRDPRYGSCAAAMLSRVLMQSRHG